MRPGNREHVSHVAMHTPRTPLHLGRPSRVQRYSSSMHRAMEEDSLMIRHDDDYAQQHQMDTACSWLVCHSATDGWTVGGNTVQIVYNYPASPEARPPSSGEASRASPQHGWRSAYSLRETLSPTQDQNQH